MIRMLIVVTHILFTLLSVFIHACTGSGAAINAFIPFGSYSVFPVRVFRLPDIQKGRKELFRNFSPSNQVKQSGT